MQVELLPKIKKFDLSFPSSRSSYLSTFRHYLFYLSSAHRDLHSFPTRRSSDLAGVGLLVDAPLAARLPLEVLDGVGDVDVARSEEHTSELQSRQYLVCRLLLEKKNAAREALTLRPFAIN